MSQTAHKIVLIALNSETHHGDPQLWTFSERRKIAATIWTIQQIILQVKAMGKNLSNCEVCV